MNAINFPGQAATVAVMTGMRRKTFLGFGWNVPEWQTLERARGLELFGERFLDCPQKMIVVAPDFSRFRPDHHQTYLYLPLSQIARRETGEMYAFYQKCIAEIRPANSEPYEAPEVAYLDGDCIQERSRGLGIDWVKPPQEIEQSIQIISKKTCLKRILPALADGIGPDEGGLYTPYNGEGIFHLLSL